MNKITLASQYLLGVIFTAFGIIGFLESIGMGIVPQPEMSLKMEIMNKGFEEMVYLMPLVKIIEIFAGILLLTGRYPNLAIVLLLPIAINILGIHLFVDPSRLPIAIVVTVGLVLLLIQRSADFKNFLLKK